MRIGIIYLGRRGAGGPLSFELAGELARRTEVFGVVSSYAENITLWRNSGISLIEVSTYRGAGSAVLSWLDQPRLWRLALRIRTYQPDVIFYPMSHTWAPFLQWYLHELPSVVAVHDPVPHPGLAYRANMLLEDLTIRQATRCIIMSTKFYADLQRRGVSLDKIDVVPLGQLTYYRKYYVPVRVESEHKGYILFFGKITTYKGLDVLLKAYRQISRGRPTIRLVVAGFGDIRPYSLLLDGLSNVEVINRWIGESEVASFFENAGMLVLPYTSASQSGLVAVAASFGLPVVATWTGGIPEQIKDGSTGLLVEPGSVDQLIAAIEYLLDNPERAAELGRSLYRDAQENRNWEIIAEKIYKSCMRAHSGVRAFGRLN